MPTNPNEFMALGMAPALALAVAVATAIDAAGADPELTVTLTGEVTGTDTAKISEGITIATTVTP